MIFAHGPAGFITTYLTKRWWSKKLTKRQILYLFIIGTLAGLFPDIDTVYYYFFSATLYHREIFTHSLVLYLIVYLVIYFIGCFKKSRFVKVVGFVIFLATLSHLFLDSLGSGVMWLYPFKTKTHGLLDFNWFAQSFLGQHFILFDLIAELFLILLALNFLFLLIKKIKKHFKKSIIISSFIFIICFVLLIFSSRYLYNSGKVDFYYKDFDGDGIVNLYDLDLDGDGILNLKDKDANGNGKENQKEIKEVIPRLEGICYDYSENKRGEILGRLGCLSNSELVIKAYQYIGIFIRTEMTNDYQKHPLNYIGSPKNFYFERNPKNLYTFFTNNGILIGEKEAEIGDVVFYGQRPWAGLVAENNSKLKVLIAQPGYLSRKIESEQAVKELGEVKKIVHLLK